MKESNSNKFRKISPGTPSELEVNPSLDLSQRPDNGKQYLSWNDPLSGKFVEEQATESDLLALKIVLERLSFDDIEKEGMSFNDIIGLLENAREKGVLVGTLSRLQRNRDLFHPSARENSRHTQAGIFTIQWHITHACNLHCRHCYDRSRRENASKEQGIKILDDLDAFCREHYVRGHVCFSGGHPILSPAFFTLYQGAAERGFSTSILANPTTRENIKRITDIQEPEYYQVSLEGLRKHNDYMRGKGNFNDVLSFLGLLKEEGVSSAVMLTLTAENIDEVLRLAEGLSTVTDYFTFNRLSPVGEGAGLLLPEFEKYNDFLHKYVDVAQNNTILGYKDNLINRVLNERGLPLFSGCTGFGCGAAFNFITLLPDGEAHACRKFPSRIGNVYESTIIQLYHSREAETYRRGARECDGCRLRHVCGGCLAVSSGLGLNIQTNRDPFCTAGKV